MLSALRKIIRTDLPRLFVCLFLEQVSVSWNDGHSKFGFSLSAHSRDKQKRHNQDVLSMAVYIQVYVCVYVYFE